jgi:predicted ATPase
MAIINLPPQPTPFIGREYEISQITALLAEPTCRLLTLVGPGGIGKTRLALEAAGLQRSAFAQGAYLVPLQPLSSPEFIVPAIAETLHFQFYSVDDPKHQLLDYLRDRSLLLVMDNFEHLLNSAQLISEILAFAPDVKVLATSRERLNLLEEWVLDVQGLSAPANETETEILDYDAVQLFLQSAQRIQVGFTLTDAQKPAVARICHLVGGMPLGLELAAAWVRALACEEIADEIERGLDLLATSARNVEPRHRTMRIVLDHSWNLLTNIERDVFQRLSVFKGGFRKEAAQNVTGTSIQTLSALVDKSLIRVSANGRYEQHELLWQYAREKLTESDDGKTVLDTIPSPN